jgi:pimeloyl-[acyl-carrier protein] methyl ester esterase
MMEMVIIPGWGMPVAIGTIIDACITVPHRTHYLALPGHAGDELQPNCDHLAAWADHCLQRAPSRAVWCGWSLGGLVALQAAQQEPHRITGLMLLTTTPRFLQTTKWPCALPLTVVEQFHQLLITDPHATIQHFLTLQAHGLAHATHHVRTIRSLLAGQPKPDWNALQVGLQLLRDSDLRSTLSAITIPTAWFFGARDTLVPKAAAEQIAILMPQSVCTTLQQAAHAPFLSHPEQLTATMESFLMSL